MQKSNRIYNIIKNIFFNLKHGTEHLNYGRDIVVNWALKYFEEKHLQELNILDLGLGEGTDLINIQNACGNKVKLNLFGLESYQPNIEKAKQAGIKAFSCNLEFDKYEFPDKKFDLIIANQILEHTKEIFWIFSEVSRILKPGGCFIVGVPNLASLLNRAALFTGNQPTSIKILGPHIRGYTKNEFIDFIETDGYFTVSDFKGANFYPFKPKVSKILAQIFPDLAVSSFYLIQRTNKEGLFKDVLNERFFETNYYVG